MYVLTIQYYITYVDAVFLSSCNCTYIEVRVNIVKHGVLDGGLLHNYYYRYAQSAIFYFSYISLSITIIQYYSAVQTRCSCNSMFGLEDLTTTPVQ